MNNLTIIERENQRVLLTSQLAEKYETIPETISNNFNRNIKRYTEGKHFYCLEGEEKRDFINNHQIDDSYKKASKLYLWTEKGAFLHAKSLNTDNAWELYDKLVDTYFNVKKEFDVKQLSPELQMFKQLFDTMAEAQIQQKQIEQKLVATNNRIDTIQEVVAIDNTSWRQETQNLLNKIAIKLGGTAQFFQQLRKESYELIERRLGVSLEIRLTNKRRRMAEEGASKSKRDKLTKIDIIAEDKKLVEGYIAIVKEMAIKYGIAD